MSWKQSLSILLTLALLLGCWAWTPIRAAAQTEPAEQEANEAEDTPDPAAVAPIIPILPVSKIELNQTTKTVNEKYGFALIASIATSGTVTWSTDNSYVATVSNSGFVSAHHAGTATITATLTDTYGETFTANCTVYVTVADGMYYIKNASSEQCITTGGSTAALYAQETSEDSRLGQLWLIEYDESSRLYRICPIRDLSQAMTANNANYVAVDEMETQFCWDIVANSFGYSIRFDGDSSENAKPVVASMPGSQIYLGNWQASLSCHWELESAYGFFLRDIASEELVSSDTLITINPGLDQGLSNLGLVLETYGSQIGGFAWESSNETVTHVDSAGFDAFTCGGETEISITATFNGLEYSEEFVLKVNKNAIIIVPGIMGSELEIAETVWSLNGTFLCIKGQTLWAESLKDDFESGVLSKAMVIDTLSMLVCNSNGESFYPVIPRDNQYGAGDTYKELFLSLEEAYANNYLIEFFAYDWRLSNQTSASCLNDFILDQEYDNVVLVCHSMGGLVASGYLAMGETQRAKVESVITLGSPLLGTPYMPYLWGQEDDDAIQALASVSVPNWCAELINLISPIDSLFGNMASIYELFPTEYYMDSIYSSRSYLSFSAYVDGELTTLDIDTYQLACDLYEHHLNSYNTTLATNACIFHDSLFQGSAHITSLVNTYYIAGWNTDTTSDISCTYNGSSVWAQEEPAPCGDGTVPLWSATLGAYYSNRAFCVDGVFHVDLVTNDDVLDFIAGLIRGEFCTVDAIGQASLCLQGGGHSA